MMKIILSAKCSATSARRSLPASGKGKKSKNTEKISDESKKAAGKNFKNYRLKNKKIKKFKYKVHNKKPNKFQSCKDER